jgi:hypothetical protein
VPPPNLWRQVKVGPALPVVYLAWLGKKAELKTTETTARRGECLSEAGCNLTVSDDQTEGARLIDCHDAPKVKWVIASAQLNASHASYANVVRLLSSHAP